MATVELQQALHGYEGGHRLISSSLPLNGAARRLVDSLSDASGTNVEGSPDLFPYLTGYPLPDQAHYVLAKTWLARGASRPGAVWTHSLFIPLVNLAKFPSLTPLLQVFREPSDLSERSVYKNALQVTVPDLRRPVDMQEDTIRVLLLALYGKPEYAVVITGEAPGTLPFIFTELWSQQWPRLRRHFTFCTGALELRRLGERPFDLQAVWAKSAGVLARPFVTRIERPYSIPDASWVDTLAQDLTDSEDGLRRFLSQFGAELSGGRRAMRVLVELYDALQALRQGPQPLRRLLEQLSAEPVVAEGVNLKQALLTNRTYGGLLPDAYEYSALTLVGTWHAAERLGDLNLHLADRARALAVHEIVLAARLARTLLRHSNRYGGEMLEPLFMVLPSRGLQLALWGNPDLLLEAFEVRPELAYHQEVWQQPRAVQEAVLQKIPAHKEVTWWTHVLSAMLEADSSIAARTLSERFGVTLLHEVLDWYAREGRLPKAWREQAAKGSIIASWLNVRPGGDLAGIQRVLLLSRPDKRSYARLPASLWLTLGERGRGRQKFTSLMVFVLCIGFRNTDGHRDALFLLTLKDVYRALEEDRLDPEARTWLIDVLSPKPLFYFGPYSSSLALSRAVVRSLADYGYHAEPFLASLDEPERAKLLEVANFDLKVKYWLKGF
jgi:hypothetical protein